MKLWYLVAATAALASADDSIEHFEKKIRPILAKNCYACHAAAALGGLRLDSREALAKSGKLNRIPQVLSEGRMPPTGKLGPADIELVTAWVASGAPMPDKAAPAAPLNRNFWSLQPVRKPAGTIDSLVAAKWQSEGLSPAPAASRRDLLRRVTHSLTGLPPTIEHVQAFLADRSPNAFEKVVDRLLASPHYGERWGRLWLDLARYSDDKLNSTQDEPYPNSFRYRNWVIDAFNRDLPYDTFVKAQIAGEQIGHPAGTGFFSLSPEMQDERVDALTKTFLGFTVGCAQCHDHKFDPIPTKDYYSLQGIFNSSKLHELPLAPKTVVDEFNARKAAVDLVDKRLKDFYERQAAKIGEILASQTAKYLMGEGEDKETQERWNKYLKADRLYHPYLNEFRQHPTRERALEIQKLILEIVEEKKVVDDKNKIKLGLDPTRNDLSQTQLDAMSRDKTVFWRDLFERSISDAGGAFNYGSGVLYYGKDKLDRFLSPIEKLYVAEQAAELEARKKEMPPQFPFLQTLTDIEKPADMNVLIRGDRNNKGELAPRRFLEALSNGERQLFQRGSGRLQLAEAIVDPKNPLTARVLVNRVWQHHFGRGIVATPSNFGQLGERPSNPELLDYLASVFVEDGWSLKKLHKRILLSDVYQRAAMDVENNLAKDPENKYFWRANRRRLDAEGIRDALLTASGELDASAGEKPASMDSAKRTVYCFVGRRKMDGYLALFDFPAPLASSEARMATNVPLQRLFFMNSAFVEQRAAALSKLLSGTEDEKIQEAYRRLYLREPDPEELRLGREYLSKSNWTSYARALLSANEFLFTP